jgi:UDP-N-acetylmuramyl pentapeptide phosphotransferase/UDP-N-acetylglucosamine-1-phosphate transferase
VGFIPRIGGISIAIGILISVILQKNAYSPYQISIFLLISCIPVFTIGLIEDFTNKISVRSRLAITTISALLVIYLLDIRIQRIDIQYIDLLFTFTTFSYFFTIFAIVGLTNAYNIIDGLNGLSSMVGLITLLVICYASFRTNDFLLIYLSLSMIMSISGFFIWNYPNGYIFLGDSGAYLIGFWVAILSILLVFRNNEISPWFPLCINAYPIFETIFSIYRRKRHHKRSIIMPDRSHLHSLIYKRLVLKRFALDNNLPGANSKTSPLLWLLSSVTTIPSIFFINNTKALITLCIAFIIFYIFIYINIVRFKLFRFK